MISNYHTASSGPESDYYYTFGGFDEGNPTIPSKTGTSGASSSTRLGSKTTTTALNGSGGSGTANKAKTPQKTRRGFGWGRGRAHNSNHKNHRNGKVGNSSSDTVSAESMGGQSLTYSTGSSLHSMGESTASSGFSRMIKVLDAEDGKNKRLGLGASSSTAQGQSGQSGHRRVPSAGQSVASSLNYSDSEASYTRFGRSSMSQRSVESMDYSTDASESQLEGSKLIQMLMEEPKNGPPPPSLKNQKERPGTTSPTGSKSKAASSTAPKTAAVAAAPSRRVSQKGIMDDDSVEPQDVFDLKVEAARAPMLRTTNGRNSSSSHNKVAPITTETRQQQQQQPQPRSAMTNATMPSPANSILQESSSSASKRDKDTTTSTSTSSSSRGSKSEKSGWACTLEAIEESIPTNVKTFLRPFLCGVL